MNNRVLKVVALLAALGLLLGVGLIAGGSIIYVLAHAGNSDILADASTSLSMVQAQAADPGYGIVIASVVADGPAAKAGVTRGDILLQVNGTELESAADLTGILSQLKAGDEVTLVVLHGDEQRTLTATLGQNGNLPYLGLVLCGGSAGDVSIQAAASGALVSQVVADSPAAQAGLQAGDVIVAVDGQNVDADHSLSDLITGHQPGDRVTLEVVRNGGPSANVEVVLGQNPGKAGAAYLGVQYSSLRSLPANGNAPWDDPRGFQFGQMPFALPGRDLPLTAVIRDVVAGSPAAAAGLKVGDAITAIDGQPVDSPQALIEAIAAHAPGDRITLTVSGQNNTQETDVQVTLGSSPDQEGKAYLGVTIGGSFRRQPSGDNTGSGSLELFGQPFEWPFGQDGEFQFPTPPDQNGCNGGAGCFGKSA